MYFIDNIVDNTSMLQTNHKYFCQIQRARIKTSTHVYTQKAYIQNKIHP